MRLTRQFALWKRLRRRNRHRHSRPARHGRTPVTHVIVLDGTLSSLAVGCETNAGLTYKLLAEEGPSAGLSLFYESGIQWPDWISTHHVILGRGMNAKIRRAYGFLASRYRPGDKVFLFGYSRGAFAVRSLAGAIDRLGLLQTTHATERNVQQVWRHYEWDPESQAAAAFSKAFCHRDVPIEMVGVWDTVKALGLRLPLVWRLSEPTHAFHNHALGRHVRRGYQALAHDETRLAFAPELWETLPQSGGAGAGCIVEQRWFPGRHGDIGGHLDGYEEARPRSNVPLVWMLENAEAAGLALPDGWRMRFPQDVSAPSVGALRGMGAFFWFRARRRTGLDPSETFHPVIDRQADLAARVAG